MADEKYIVSASISQVAVSKMQAPTATVLQVKRNDQRLQESCRPRMCDA